MGNAKMGWWRGVLAFMLAAGTAYALPGSPDVTGPERRAATKSAEAERQRPSHCPPGQFQCPRRDGANGICADHQADPANCGACGVFCKKGETCAAGKCSSPSACPPGQTQCARANGAKGPCADHQADPANCGACGVVCKKGETCAAGKCSSPSACPPGQTQCARANGANGLCSDHQADPMNCGACGVVCKKGETCAVGKCSGPNACPPGQTQCARADGAKGLCSDHQSDLVNCGVCGVVCKKGEACTAGKCAAPNRCAPGQTQCLRADGAKGPCSTLQTDPSNCGACGVVCKKGQSCTAGVCQ